MQQLVPELLTQPVRQVASPAAAGGISFYFTARLYQGLSQALGVSSKQRFSVAPIWGLGGLVTASLLASVAARPSFDVVAVQPEVLVRDVSLGVLSFFLCRGSLRQFVPAATTVSGHYWPKFMRGLVPALGRPRSGQLKVLKAAAREYGFAVFLVRFSQ
mmetsp:Transcript_98367/g.225882  ORF Transcript_98367/g.225882 Transcript_98367/m.225882 type:complete len:159 (+) Transcript_98367:243-719(+)